MSVVSKLDLSMTVKVIPCKSGDFVGVGVEYPIVVQGVSIEEVKEKMVGALTMHFMHDSEEIIHKFTQG